MGGETRNGLKNVAAALQRTTKVLSRRPDMGLHDDAPATARWVSGTRVVSSHENGMRMTSDMPSEIGGSGDQVSPGWMFRAGLAACAATRIAMGAAAEGIELASLEVRASSRSDTRGLLGMTEADGGRVYAGPCDVQLLVRIDARGESHERLRAVIEEACRCAPISNAVRDPVPVALQIEFEDA